MPENKLFLLLYILLNMELSTVEQMAPSAVTLQFMSSTLQCAAHTNVGLENLVLQGERHHQSQRMSSLECTVSYYGGTHDKGTVVNMVSYCAARQLSVGF
jgi:hypothetical protein